MNALHQYHSRLSDEQVENLREFASHGERVDPIAFVGRNDILQRVQTLLRSKRRSARVESATQIVQGAPGAGKTSLLNELARVNSGANVSVIRMEADDLSESIRVAERFLQQSSQGESIDIGKAEIRTRRPTTDVKFAQHQEGWETRKASTLEMIEKGMLVWQALSPILEVDANHLFLLLVDEAQRVIETPGKSFNEIVTSLHAGGTQTSGLRILPVFAGLSDTSVRLQGVGLSRVAGQPYRLSSLSFDEARQATEGFMRDGETGLWEIFSSNSRDELLNAFALASEGWPRHLHHYHEGLASAIVDDCDRHDPTGTISIDAVLTNGHRARCNYYNERLEAANLGYVENAMVAVTRKNRSADTLISDDIVDYMVDRFEEDPQSTEEKIQRAVHAGVLERRRDIGRRHYAYPIPSFSTYIASNCDPDQTIAKMHFAVQSQMEDM